MSLVKHWVPVAPAWLIQRVGASPVREVLLRKQPTNVVTELQLSNKPDGIDVNLLQLWKQRPKSVTSWLLSNKFAGIELNPALLHPRKHELNVVTSGQLSNKPDGIGEEILPQNIKQFLKLKTIGLLSNKPDGIAEIRLLE